MKTFNAWATVLFTVLTFAALMLTAIPRTPPGQTWYQQVAAVREDG